MHMFRASHLEQLVCPMCGTENENNWKPKFFREVHYKSCNCAACNYEFLVRTEENNSGHY